MLRLTCTTQTPSQTVLQIDGQITADQVPLVASEVERSRGQSTRLTLTLDGVTHIDPEGISLLKDCCDQGVVLQGGSVFIRALLKSEGLLP